MSRTETVLALVVAVVITIAGGGVFYFVSTMAVHPDPAAIPSMPGVRAERYGGAIEESRRLAHALLLQDNLPDCRWPWSRRLPVSRFPAS